MQVSFIIEGEKQLSRNLRNVSTEMGNWISTFKKVGQTLKGLFSGPVFTSQGSVIGEPWKPRKTPASWPLLNKTGHMKNNFAYRAAGKYVMITNTTSYFKYHQSKKPRHHLPRRVMMKIDETRKNQIIHTFNQDMVYRLHKRLS